MILRSEVHINKVFPSPQLSWSVRTAGEGKITAELPWSYHFVWKAMPAAVADYSNVLQIGAEWQRQQNYVHHQRLRSEEQAGILNKWGKRSRKTTVSLPFCSIKRVTIHVILLKQ